MPHPPPDQCSVRCVNPERIASVQARRAEDEDLAGVAEIFRNLGDYTRVRILEALSLEEMCVCDLQCLLNVSQSAVSHQLRLLRAAGLVKYRREGKMVFYSLDDDHVRDLFALALEHAREHKE